MILCLKVSKLFYEIFIYNLFQIMCIHNIQITKNINKVQNSSSSQKVLQQEKTPFTFYRKNLIELLFHQESEIQNQVQFVQETHLKKNKFQCCQWQQSLIKYKILEPKLSKELDEKYSDQKIQQRLQSNSTDGSFVFYEEEQFAHITSKERQVFAKEVIFFNYISIKEEKAVRFTTQFIMFELQYFILIININKLFSKSKPEQLKDDRKWNSLKFIITIGQRG
ncbi:unnamed protein product [Paramecium primaurelia]|uniref:Uncharacterized protein n=1 Tax=Paramecium primaurelia TaxID=5886 RepID=A0A8S1QFV6_PARPR|nr:unnamed protein product [Paramecium primaurelia]